MKYDSRKQYARRFNVRSKKHGLAVIVERWKELHSRPFHQHVRTAYQGYLFSSSLLLDEFKEFMLAEMDSGGSLCSAPIFGNILAF